MNTRNDLKFMAHHRAVRAAAVWCLQCVAAAGAALLLLEVLS